MLIKVSGMWWQGNMKFKNAWLNQNTVLVSSEIKFDPIFFYCYMHFMSNLFVISMVQCIKG